jgi:hypothetical protein
MQHVKQHDLVKCEFCTAMISVKNVKKHNKKKHSDKIETKAPVAYINMQTICAKNQVAVAVLGKKNVPVSDYTRCPNCAKLILKTEFINHLLKEHKSGETERVLPISPVRLTGKITGSFRATIQKPRQSRSGEAPNGADATCGYHIIREHGRFGSHPSHDGFDDESEA